MLTPGFEHRRNFIEACICDAAIALGESDGTSSEALFALYLGRPLLLVNVERRSPSSAATLALKKRATARISVPVNPVAAIDQGIAAAYRWAEEPDRTPVYRSLPTDGPAATQMIRDVLQDAVARKVDMRALTDESAWNAFVTTTMRAAGRRP